MKRRWLTGVLLFAFGFGSALMVKLPLAGAAATATQGIVEGSLKYVDGEDAFELSYPSGSKNYIVLATRDLDSVEEGEPQVTYQTGGASFSKKGLRSLVVLRLEPLIAWHETAERCGNFPILCVLPPPPPPPIHQSATVVKPGQP